MRFLIFSLFTLLTLAWWSPVYAQTDDAPQPDALVVSDAEGGSPLGPYLQLLEDPGGELTIEDVSSAENGARFVPSEEAVPNLGFTDSAYWLRFRLRSESAEAERRFLELAYANMHYADLYSPIADGDGFDLRQAGAMRPLAARDIVDPHVVFDLTIPAQSEQTYYLRFENGASMTLPLTLWQPDSFFAESARQQGLHWLLLGIIAGLLGYNLFLLASLRDIDYLYLALMLAGILLFDLTQSGILDTYIAPDWYALKLRTIPLLMLLIFIPLILLNDSFLSAEKSLPRIHLLNRALILAWIAAGISSFFVDYHTSSLVIVPLIVATLVLQALTVLVAWQRGFRSARFLVAAWLGAIAGTLVFVLVRMGLLPSNLFTESLLLVVFAWMAICWSISLADRYNLLKEEAESANRDLRSSQHRLTQTLEAMPVGVVVYGPDQKPSFVNRRTIEILSNPARNLGPDPTLGRTLGETLDYFSFRIAGSDEAYPLEAFPVYRALQGESVAVEDVEADLVDWRVPLEVWASPVKDGSGSVESAVVAFQDITERKRSEVALRASEKHFRVIVENNFDGIAFLARDRQVLYVSPSYERLNGVSAAEMIGRSGIGTIHPEDQAHVAETFQELLAQPGGSVSDEYRIRHVDGSWVWVETRAINMLDDAHVQAVVLNSRDITERKETEVELASYRAHLEQLVVERTEELEAINVQLTGEMAERAVLEGLLHKRIQWMSALAQVRQRVKGTADLPAVFEELSMEILRLLDAGSLFVLRWPEKAEGVEFLCRPVSRGLEVDEEAIGASFAEYSPLRRELAPGKTVVLSANEVEAMPEPISACFRNSGMQSLLLTPLAAGESVTGVLGTALTLPRQELSMAQTELISKITLDLAGLEQEATFLDQSRTLVAAEERNRLARDLHDSVTQVLFSASLVAEVLPRIWRRDPGKAMQSLEELRGLTRGALAEMRTMLLELRPSAVARSPLPDLLTQLTEASTSRTALPFKLLIEKTPLLPEEVHAAFYRIAQEALNNVGKHAHASEVTLGLSARPLAAAEAGEVRYEVRLVIEDDGLGFAPENEKLEHLGMGIMRERAADIEASLIIESRIGEGTRVDLSWCGEVEEAS